MVPNGDSLCETTADTFSATISYGVADWLARVRVPEGLP
jgi:hypothetical protein